MSAITTNSGGQKFGNIRNSTSFTVEGKIYSMKIKFAFPNIKKNDYLLHNILKKY